MKFATALLSAASAMKLSDHDLSDYQLELAMEAPTVDVLHALGALTHEELMDIGMACTFNEDLCADGWEEFMESYCGDGQDPACRKMGMVFEHLAAMHEGEGSDDGTGSGGEMSLAQVQ